MSDHGHAKHPRLQELEAMVRDGRIDTLIVAITDMQGRLMGKRVQAQAFLNGVIDHGAHFCTYLLGTDMEMNTPDGFALMNWETGYGDGIAKPVWDTLRVLPWLEKTALVLGDATDEETQAEIPVAPRSSTIRTGCSATSLASLGSSATQRLNARSAAACAAASSCSGLSRPRTSSDQSVMPAASRQRSASRRSISSSRRSIRVGCWDMHSG